MSKKQNYRSLYFFIVLFLLTSFTYIQKQQIYDWWRLRDYVPPAGISQLADNTQFSQLGKKLFFVHKPKLEDKDTFRSNCTDSEQTIVLGCYITHQSIHIYDVEDDRLSGIEEVTAAHEMLHAGYDRLSDSEKYRVNTLLLNESKNLKNQRILDTLEQYRKKDPTVVNNELHSILGTEVRNLNPELEKYYQKYFFDRTKVVEFSEKYEQEFSSRQNAVKEFDIALNQLKQEIENIKSELKLLSTEIESERDRLDTLKNKGDNAGYNSGVDGYNGMIRSYNRKLESLKAKIAKYNNDVSSRNALVNEEQELIDAIDTRTPSAK